jgi:hypothetical protein
VIDLNGEMQKSGNALTAVMRQQIGAQTTLENIDEAIDTLKVQLPGYLASSVRNVCAF